MAEFEDPLTERQANYIAERSSQLYTVLTTAADAAVSFLFLVNAGGAVATLSFLGTSATVRAMPTPKLALACFIAGLLLVGILRAFRVHDYQKAFNCWHKDYNNFVAGQLSWNQLVGNDETRSETSKWEYILGYASFTCIFGGAALGAYGLMSLF